MFHSPMMTSNTWNVVINSEDIVEANQQVFKNLLKESGDNPMVKGDNNYMYTTREFGAYTLQGAMSSSGTAKINLIVKCTEPADPSETNADDSA